MRLHDISDWCRRGDNLTNYPYIGEIDINAEDYPFGTTLKIGDTYYSIGVMNKQDNIAGAREITIDDDPDEQNYTQNIKCPYYGYEDRDSWECGDSDEEHECGECSGTFSYERVVTVEYNSCPEKSPEFICGNWIKK